MTAHASSAASDAVRHARTRFESLLDEGRKNASVVLNRIDAEQPTDRIARAHALRFAPSARAPGLDVNIGQDAVEPLSSFALSQATARAGIPKAFADDLLAPERAGWGSELLAHSLNELVHKTAPDGRFLLRSVDGRVRGFLSDRYRRLDSRPIVAAFMRASQAVGALPLRGHVTETRIAIKVVLDRVFEPIEGGHEVLMLGAVLSSSDFGAGPLSISFYAERLICLNGLIAEQALRTVHIGGRLGDDVAFSQRTYELDTEAQASAVADMVYARLGSNSTARFEQAIRDANATHLTAARIDQFLTKALPKGDRQQVVDAFNSADVVMLPPGQSAYRLSQALGFVANATADEDKRLSLQRLAGDAMSLAVAA